MSNIAVSIIKILQILYDHERNDTGLAQVTNETRVILPVIPQTPSTPTQIMYPEDTTTNSTMSISKDESETGKINIFLIVLVFYK